MSPKQEANLKCARAQEEILESDDVRRGRDFTPELLSHLEICVDCRAFRGQVVKMEMEAASLPAAPGELDALESYLAARGERRNHAQPQEAKPVAGTVGAGARAWWGKRLSFPRWAAVAMLTAAVGVGLWIAAFSDGRANQAMADQGLVVRLAAWNTQIGNVRDARERLKLYRERVAAFSEQLASEKLNAQSREVAVGLLANGAWLARHDDPIEAAARFNDLASQVLDQLDGLKSQGDITTIAEMAGAYSELVERGVAANIERAEGQVNKTAGQSHRLGEVAEESAGQARRVEKLMDRVPGPARKEMQKAMESQLRRGRWQKIPPGQLKKLNSNKETMENESQ